MTFLQWKILNLIGFSYISDSSEREQVLLSKMLLCSLVLFHTEVLKRSFDRSSCFCAHPLSNHCFPTPPLMFALCCKPPGSKSPSLTLLCGSYSMDKVSPGWVLACPGMFSTSSVEITHETWDASCARYTLVTPFAAWSRFDHPHVLLVQGFLCHPLKGDFGIRKSRTLKVRDLCHLLLTQRFLWVFNKDEHICPNSAGLFALQKYSNKVKRSMFLSDIAPWKISMLENN